MLIFQCSQNLGEEINGKGYECPGSGLTQERNQLKAALEQEQYSSERLMFFLLMM
jgi:hypothetical protein